MADVPVPGYVGIVNYMGARFTATAQPTTIACIVDWAKKVEDLGFVLVPISMVTIRAKSS